MHLSVTSGSRDERYQVLVELAPDGILIHDGVRIALANAAAIRLAGATSRAQVVGQPIDRFLDPPYLKSVQAQLTNAVHPAEPAPPLRDTFRRLDGSMLEVEVRTVAFMDQGRPSAHVVVRDITERLDVERGARLVDERLRQAQRMESVGALAGGVAHEVNNMMQVVLGFSDFLHQDERLPAACREDVQEIIRAASRAAAVTKQLLAYGRRAVHLPKTVDLDAMVRGAEPMLRLLLGEGRRLVLEANQSPMVCVDPGQFEQVLVNLTLNARDATPTDGTVTITVLETELSGGTSAADGAPIPSGRYATLRVQDTGVGMDATTQARIFEPFFTTKPVGQSTGLGLAAVHGLLAQNGGCITVVSAPDQGTTFTVYLPILPPSKLDERHAPPEHAHRGGGRSGATVLVVDDEAAVRAVVARSLERGGFRVLQAANGNEALERIDPLAPPALVLTDLMMPGLGGAELADRLWERWPVLPIIFMSAYSAEELQRHGSVGGQGALIQKPCDPTQLLAVVSTALDRRDPIRLQSTD